MIIVTMSICVCVLAHLLYRGKCKHENRWLYRSQLYTRTNTHTHMQVMLAIYFTVCGT